MLVYTDNKESVLSNMSYLPIDEGVSPEMERYSLLRVVESPTADKYIISLENAMELANEMDTDLDTVIAKTAEMNRISESVITLSVRPSNLLLNEDVFDQYTELLKEGVEVQAVVYRNELTKEMKCLDEMVMNGDAEGIDALTEGFFDRTLGNVKKGALSGFGAAAKDTASALAQAGGYTLKNAIGAGIQKGVEGGINRRMEGMDQRVQDFARRHGVSGEGLDIAGDVVKGFRQSIARATAEGITGAGFSKLQSILDNLTQKIGFFSAKLAKGDLDANKKSLLQKGLDALKRMKDAVMRKLKGGK